MTIRYPDGRAVEGILLSRMEETMRVAVQDADDGSGVHMRRGNVDLREF